MEESSAITTVEALLETPAVQRARVIELSLWDTVHFRIHQPEAILAMVEARLRQRDTTFFEGYAESRLKAERTMRDASLLKKIEASCVGNSHWVPSLRVLYSTELEVWMDVSYPNPWTLELYQKGLARKISLHVPRVGQFSKPFHQLLLQKNGFERLENNPPPDQAVKLLIGDPYHQAPPVVHLRPEIPNQRPHVFASGHTLGEWLANGTLIKDREEQVARVPDAGERFLRDLGYRLIGPSLVLLFQHLAVQRGTVGFTGLGSGFMSTVGQSLKHPWPWIPAISSSENAARRLSLFPDTRSNLSLMPDPGNPSHSSIFRLEDCAPAHLLLPPLASFLTAAFIGPKAAAIQSSASAFVRDFAQVTRGLELLLPETAVIAQWRQQLLSPNDDFIDVLLHHKVLPGFTRPGNPWRARRLIKTGPWPTGTYLRTKGLSRQYVHLRIPKRVRAIQTWRSNLAKGRPV